MEGSKERFTLLSYCGFSVSFLFFVQTAGGINLYKYPALAMVVKAFRYLGRGAHCSNYLHTLLHHVT